MVFLVAELGVNWNGDFELVQKMMLNAKTLGCNAVKFQAFNETILGNHPQLPLLMKSTITEENIKRIDQIANDIGIEWFCTPMYPEAVSFLNPFVKRFKIRELDGRVLLKDQQTAQRMGKLNFHIAQEKADWDKNYLKLESIYREMTHTKDY